MDRLAFAASYLSIICMLNWSHPLNLQIDRRKLLIDNVEYRLYLLKYLMETSIQIN